MWRDACQDRPGEKEASKCGISHLFASGPLRRALEFLAQQDCRAGTVESSPYATHILFLCVRRSLR